MKPCVIASPFGAERFTSTLYYGADARVSLRALPAQSVHCVVTSPPYWGLRDYGTGSWAGGDPDCAHSVGGQVSDSKYVGAITTGQLPGVDASRCRRCGAIRTDAQIGLEQTPDQYVAALVEVFREVRRVLRPDGTVWLNLGDSYAGNNGGPQGKTSQRAGRASARAQDIAGAKGGEGLKPKDLVGIPWEVALALRADGWYLRADVIWAKRNPMPESVRDRPTRSHEYVFLLTRSPTYYYDADAIREPATTGSPGDASGRNKRSVWTLNPRPYRGAHFATMPPDLAELCIRAGSGEQGCCSVCGTPRVRETEPVSGPPDPTQRTTAHYDTADRYGAGNRGNGGFDRLARKMRDGAHHRTTAGWVAGCACPDSVSVPCTVADPFSGSGTTGRVANRLGRNYIGLDLNPDYLPLARARILGEDPPGAEPPEAPEAPEADSVLSLLGG